MADPQATPAAPASGAPTDPKAPTTPTGAAGEPTAGDPKATPATGSPAEGETLLTDPSKGGKQDPAKPEEGKQPDGKPTGAPEKYDDFKIPEGVSVDPEAIKSFHGVAKELGLSQENAQKLVDYQAGLMKKMDDAASAGYQEMQQKWREESLKVLGPKAEEQLSFAAKTRERFGDPALNEVLKESGLGNHPAFVQLFVRIGKAISEDNLAEGVPATEELSIAQRIFGSTKK